MRWPPLQPERGDSQTLEIDVPRSAEAASAHDSCDVVGADPGVVELPDGQRLVATTTRHVAVSPGSPVTVGFAPEAVIPLED